MVGGLQRKSNLINKVKVQIINQLSYLDFPGFRLSETKKKIAIFFFYALNQKTR